MPSGQAVVPGQGQTVNVAGVKVGEVGSVKLEDGIAVIDMNIQEKYRPIYRDASVLLRPKTGLKDMYLALDPGTPRAGDLAEGGRVQLANTLPDVNSDEILAQLDGDTRAYLQILLNAGGTAFDDKATGADKRYAQTAAQDLRETFKRFEPSARYGAQITRQLAERRQNLRHVIHNFQELSTALAHRDRQLASLVDSANANFQAFASQESSLREAVRLFPGALEQTRQTLTKTSSLAARARPRAPAAAAVRARAGARAPEDPALLPRDHADHPRPDPARSRATCSPRCATCARATNDLAVVTPRLTRTFSVLNSFFNILAYDPPGPASPFLFWAAWAAHAGATLFDLQDAHGPVRAAIVLVTARPTTSRAGRRTATRSSACSTALLNLPPEQQACPQNQPPDDLSRDQADAQLRPDLRDGRVRAVVLRHPRLPVAQLRRLGAAAAGGLPGDRRLPGGHAARAGGGRAHLRRARGPRQEEGAERADRADRHGARDRRALRADPEGHAGDPAPEDAARRDLRGALARHARARAACRTAAGWRPARCPTRSSSTRSCAPSTRRRASASPPGSTRRAWRPLGNAEASERRARRCSRRSRRTRTTCSRCCARRAARRGGFIRDTGVRLRRAHRAQRPAARPDPQLEPGLGGRSRAATQQLADTFRVLPTFLREGRETTRRLTRFADDTNPLITQLRPAARELSPTLIDLDALAPDLKGAVQGPRPARARRPAGGLPATERGARQHAARCSRRLDPFLRNFTPDRRLPRPLQARDRRLLRERLGGHRRPAEHGFDDAGGPCTTCAPRTR